MDYKETKSQHESSKKSITSQSVTAGEGPSENVEERVDTTVEQNIAKNSEGGENVEVPTASSSRKFLFPVLQKPSIKKQTTEKDEEQTQQRTIFCAEFTSEKGINAHLKNIGLDVVIPPDVVYRLYRRGNWMKYPLMTEAAERIKIKRYNKFWRIDGPGFNYIRRDCRELNLSMTQDFTQISEKAVGSGTRLRSKNRDDLDEEDYDVSLPSSLLSDVRQKVVKESVAASISFTILYEQEAQRLLKRLFDFERHQLVTEWEMAKKAYAIRQTDWKKSRKMKRLCDEVAEELIELDRLQIAVCAMQHRIQAEELSGLLSELHKAEKGEMQVPEKRSEGEQSNASEQVGTSKQGGISTKGDVIEQPDESMKSEVTEQGDTSLQSDLTKQAKAFMRSDLTTEGEVQEGKISKPTVKSPELNHFSICAQNMIQLIHFFRSGEVLPLPSTI